MSLMRFWIAGAIVLVAATLSGCGKSAGKPAANVEGTAAAHSHEEWWCDEHGMREEICVQCHANLAEKYKAMGDWCEKHDRPDSQCFVCHPQLEADFAKEYVAKYGKQPPKPAGG